MKTIIVRFVILDLNRIIVTLLQLLNGTIGK